MKSTKSLIVKMDEIIIEVESDFRMNDMSRLYS